MAAPLEQVYSRRGVAVRPPSALTHRVLVFPSLGPRCLLPALVDLRLGCVRCPWSKYGFNRRIERAWLTPRPWVPSIDSSCVINTESPRQNSIRSISLHCTCATLFKLWVGSSTLHGWLKIMCMCTAQATLKQIGNVRGRFLDQKEY